MNEYIVYFDSENYEVIEAETWEKIENYLYFRNDERKIIAAFRFDNIIGFCEKGYGETEND